MAGKSPLSVMYIEVNNTNFWNTGCYTMRLMEPIFDIGIIFAANINYDVPNQRAVLYFNLNVTTVLDNVDIYVRPLQARGIKVLLSILGNHQGAGFCNFQTEASARDFAMQLKDAVTTYGLDGIDFDDEYSDYGNNGTGQPNAFSFLFLLRALRDVMPDKIISFYCYGPASSRLTYQDLIAGTYLNYSWNAIYGTWIVPNVPGLGKAALGPAAVNVTTTSGNTANSLAQRTINEEYGVYLMYNLPNTGINTYLSGITEILYNAPARLTANCLREWTPATETDLIPKENAEKAESGAKNCEC